MKPNERKSNKWIKHVISIVLTGGVVLAGPWIILIFISFFDYSAYSNATKIKVIFVLTLCLISIPCYFICRYNIKSVWYVPILVNLGTLFITCCIVSNYWASNAKLELIIASVVSAIFFGILGSIRGSKSTVSNR